MKTPTTHLRALTAIAISLLGLGATANDIEPGKEFYDVVYAPKPITLDGELTEWSGVPILADPKFAVPKGTGGDASPNYVLFEEYNGGSWTGPDDQTSAVQIVYDAENVYFGFVVTDDYHENAANSAWNGDSIQLMIASADRTAQVALYNYALGGIEGETGEVIIMHEAGPGASVDCECPTEAVIKRDATTKKTTYEIKLPKAALGLESLKGGPQFGLGMAINDGDEATPGQKGWGGLGAHALVFGKSPAETALITLKKGNDIEPTKEYYTALKTTQNITIDGNLAEWTGAPVLADPKFAVPKFSGTNESPNYVLFEEYNGGSWTGPDDQTSAVQVVYDADNVYFGFVVTDDYHENAANSAWNGDSVQLMIASADRTAQVALYNYALGGIEGETTEVVIMHEAGPAANADCECLTEAVIVRDGTTKKTTYEIKLPAASLGLTPPLTVDTKFGLGMAINDGDELTPGQKGWGGLGAHALVFGKTPSETAEVTLGTTVTGGDRIFLSAVNPGPAAFTFRASDKGSSIVDPASAKLTIDGAPASLTSKKTGDATDFTHVPASAFPPGSSHTYALEVSDTLGTKVTDSGSFKIAVIKIGMNFGTEQPDPSTPSSLLAEDIAGVASVAQGNWNNLADPTPLTGLPVLLRTDTGANTATTVYWEAANNWASTGLGEENNSFAEANLVLMTGYLDTGAPSTTTVTIENIPVELYAGNGYDVYVYALGGVPGRGGGYRIVDLAGTVLKPYVLAKSGTSPTTFVEVPQDLGSGVFGEGNYIVFKALKAPSIKVEATTEPPQATGDTPRAPINAIQLVPSPAAAKPTLAVKKTAGGVEITYQGVLQSAATVAGPYTDVNGASSPYTSATGDAQRYFRARN
ncbi:MAG: sugar-binding protein [Limisphaerales bacterium]